MFSESGGICNAANRLVRISSNTHSIDVHPQLAQPCCFNAVTGPSDPTVKTKTTSEKIRQITGSDDALAFHNAKQGFLTQPWYLRPSFSSDQLVTDNDLNVKAGTLNALVEKMVIDPLSEHTSHCCRTTV